METPLQKLYNQPWLYFLICLGGKVFCDDCSSFTICVTLLKNHTSYSDFGAKETLRVCGDCHILCRLQPPKEPLAKSGPMASPMKPRFDDDSFRSLNSVDDHFPAMQLDEGGTQRREAKKKALVDLAEIEQMLEILTEQGDTENRNTFDARVRSLYEYLNEGRYNSFSEEVLSVKRELKSLTSKVGKKKPRTTSEHSEPEPVTQTDDAFDQNADCVIS